MNKTTIKIIKRKDAGAAAEIKTKNVQETALAAGGEKGERSLHRKMADTVSNWIAERRENNRAEEITALRIMFGSESLLNRTV